MRPLRKTINWRTPSTVLQKEPLSNRPCQVVSYGHPLPGTEQGLLTPAGGPGGAAERTPRPGDSLGLSPTAHIGWMGMRYCGATVRPPLA